MEPMADYGYGYGGCLFCLSDQEINHDTGEYYVRHTPECAWLLAAEMLDSIDPVAASGINPYFGYHKDLTAEVSETAHLPIELDTPRWWD